MLRLIVEYAPLVQGACILLLLCVAVRILVLHFRKKRSERRPAWALVPRSPPKNLLRADEPSENCPWETDIDYYLCTKLAGYSYECFTEHLTTCGRCQREVGRRKALRDQEVEQLQRALNPR